MNRLIMLLTGFISLALSCKQGSVPATTAQKHGVFSTAEWNILQSPDSVKLFRLREINRYTPMAMPAEMTDAIVFTFKDEENLLREFYDEKNRLMTSQETRDLLPFIAQQTETKNIYQYKDKCHYEPGAGIKFFQGKKTFNLLMCFNCNVWAFERDTTMYYVDFNRDQRADLVRYAKKLFPEDPDFQNLKE